VLLCVAQYLRKALSFHMGIDVEPDFFVAS